MQHFVVTQFSWQDIGPPDWVFVTLGPLCCAESRLPWMRLLYHCGMVLVGLKADPDQQLASFNALMLFFGSLK